jgi:hypothetical protein
MPCYLGVKQAAVAQEPGKPGDKTQEAVLVPARAVFWYLWQTLALAIKIGKGSNALRERLSETLYASFIGKTIRELYRPIFEKHSSSGFEN